MSWFVDRAEAKDNESLKGVGMNKTLVELVQDSHSVEVMLIESAGEMTPQLEQILAVTELNMAEKIDRYAFILEKMEAMETFYKMKADSFYKIASQCKNAQNKLKDNLKFAMEQMKADELLGLETRFKKIPTTGTLNITDEDMIPVEFKKEVTTTEIDKKALKEAASKGQVPGCEFVPGSSIRTYANKQITESRRLKS